MNSLEHTSQSIDQSSEARSDAERLQAISSHYREVIQLLGEDPEREGLIRTPERAAQAQLDFTQGYRLDPVSILKSALFQEEAVGQQVMVQNIDFYSMCEHHLVPFYGTAHIAYKPRDGVIVGLSKVPRALDALARRLQVQERMTEQLGRALKEALNPFGVAVALEATHLCMVMRGVQKMGSTTVTTFFDGYSDNEQNAFLRLIR